MNPYREYDAMEKNYFRLLSLPFTYKVYADESQLDLKSISLNTLKLDENHRET
jgi:hypothetical protein